MFYDIIVYDCCLLQEGEFVSTVNTKREKEREHFVRSVLMRIW